MQDSMMAQIGMDHEHPPDNSYGGGAHEGWVEINNGYHSQHQSPIYEHGGFQFLHPSQHNIPHSLPSEHTFPPRMAPPPVTHATHHQQLLPLIMPGTSTWPSMLAQPTSYHNQGLPAVIPPTSSTGKGLPKLPSIHPSPSPRKTLTDADRRRMCQYHEDNPSVKQTEIGAMFGVERSTVSKVLRQREKYLFPEDRSISPVKRVKGKFPDIERALSNWVRNSQKSGHPITDTAIKEKARFFATTVGNNESHLKTNSTSWLEKFKQKNNIGSNRLARRASETNISDRGSQHPDSTGPSAAHTPNGISPASPRGLTSLSPMSGSKSDDEIKSADSMNSYFEFGQSGLGLSRHSNNQSNNSLSSIFTDTAPSSFSGGPTSPSTPFAFSPDGSTMGSWNPHQRLPLPGNAFNQRPRSQTFPNLGIDPLFMSSESSEPLTPKYSLADSAPPSGLESPIQEIPTSFSHNTTISPPPLRHSSSSGSMAPPSGVQSPARTCANSPTQDDARRALDTLLSFFQQAPTGLVDQNEYMTVLKLTEKLRIQTNTPLPGGLHRIAEQDCEVVLPKLESLS